MRTVVIDGVTYHAETPVEAEVHALLRDVHGVLWIEAFYDARNADTCKFAKPLAVKIKRVNELIGFKK